MSDAGSAFRLTGELSTPQESDYLIVAAWARHVVTLVSAGAVEEFPALFGAVEWGLIEGEDAAQTLLVTGFLEALQEAALKAAMSDETFDPDLFTQWMGPDTNAWYGLLTAIRNSPSDLKTVVRTLQWSRDVRSMTRVELRTLHRADRHLQQNASRRKT